jgi:DNA-binding response OmpR family regulator
MIKKILIIEDDPALFQVYLDLFSSREIKAMSAKTGADGLALINSEKPDLILLDIMLPGGMNGFDVLEKVEANPETKSIPVVVLTNLDSEEQVAKIIGAKKYFVKANTTTDEVVKAVMSYLQ